MNLQQIDRRREQPDARRSTCPGSAALVAAALLLSLSAAAEAGSRRPNLSSDLAKHFDSGSTAPVDVIVSGTPDHLDRLARRHGLVVKKVLSSGVVFTASRAAFDSLAQDEEAGSVSGDAIVHSHMAVTTSMTGAAAAWAGQVASLGRVDGSGIGVAVIDSGIANHPALKGRVVANVDFTDTRGTGQDLYGHGTHIAGIIAARGFNNSAEGAASGMAPAAHLINLKVLGADGSGQASDVIAAIDFAIKYRKEFAIRVINLSLGAAPTQSYREDPICQAVERAVRAGLVVVASAGNYGEFEGKQVYGSITSPGISPYAITVGAVRTQGTVDPLDDEIAPWSSKGPTLVDHIVKPDLVAPGSKIVSTAAAGATLMEQYPDRLIDGPGARDYFSMSGTSMAAAVVSGAAALLLDGESSLTPLQVKLSLQASADFMPAAGLLASGAGTLDLADLDELASLKPTHAGAISGFTVAIPNGDSTSQMIVWGDIIVWGEIIVWGNSTDIIVWGNSTVAQDIIVWGNSTVAQDIIVWGNSTADIIVWGNATSAQDIIVWGNSTNDIIVWGNSVADIIVWGNSAADIIVWGNSLDGDD